jgi:uncharacterized membrane-anchored protein YitT (DUF2179 family)
MKQLTNKRAWTDFLAETLGGALIALGIYNFAVEAAFPMTGFSGVSIILYQLFDLPIGFTTVLLNIPVAILCYKLLGKGFFFRSLRCMLVSSALIDYAAPLLPVYQGSRMLAAVCTGVLAGLGYALIYMRSSSTGGTDFIIMAVKSKAPHLSLGKIAFAVDSSVVLVGGLLFRDIDGMIYGMIVSYIMSVVVDKALYGVSAGKVALMVTDQGEKTAQAIETCCGRGCTILHSQGGYSGRRLQTVMCACNNKQMHLVQKAVRRQDPGAFVVVLESNEVLGEGFQSTSPDEEGT